MTLLWYAIANNSIIAPLLLIAGTAVFYTSTRSVGQT
jgi:hypothetical protein